MLKDSSITVEKNNLGMEAHWPSFLLRTREHSLRIWNPEDWWLKIRSRLIYVWI